MEEWVNYIDDRGMWDRGNFPYLFRISRITFLFYNMYIVSKVIRALWVQQSMVRPECLQISRVSIALTNEIRFCPELPRHSQPYSFTKPTTARALQSPILIQITSLDGANRTT